MDINITAIMMWIILGVSSYWLMWRTLGNVKPNLTLGDRRFMICVAIFSPSLVIAMIALIPIAMFVVIFDAFFQNDTPVYEEDNVLYIANNNLSKNRETAKPRKT